MESELLAFLPSIVLGDINENVNSNQHWISILFVKFGLSRRINQATTDANTMLDIVFTRDLCDTSVLDSVFSFHKPIVVAV